MSSPSEAVSTLIGLFRFAGPALFFCSEDEINVRLDKIMVDALKKIWDTADRHKISLRTATFAVPAREERGLYP